MGKIAGEVVRRNASDASDASDESHTWMGRQAMTVTGRNGENHVDGAKGGRREGSMGGLVNVTAFTPDSLDRGVLG